MYGFTGHRIRKNHRSTIPSNMIFYDSETKYTMVNGEQHHTLDFGWINHCRYDKENGFTKSVFKLITDQSQFCMTVDKYAYRKSTLYIFGHNIFFDLQVSGFFKYMTRYGWILDFYYDEGLTYILCIRKENRVIKCISTTNYFGCSLKELGKIIARKKTEVDFEKSTRDEKIEYCHNDVMIVRESMEKYFQFILEHDLGMFAMTKSSQSFNAYRHRFMNQGIFIHNEESVIELERLAYHGGRCECYHIGQLNHSKYVCLDINSMYPYIMLKQKLPTMLIGYGESASIDELKILLENHAVIAEVEVETDQPIYAIRKDNKVIFPIGRFLAFLCTEGCKTAIKNGHVIRINRYAAYEKAYLFTGYVEYFYDLRNKYKDNDNKVYAELCKYFMNTLYGKFGQQRTITTFEENITFDGYYRERVFDIPTMEWYIYTKLLNKLWVEEGKENAKNTLVAIPAHITEYGRLLLWDLIQRAGERGTVYCDTDSLIVRGGSALLLQGEIDKRALGKLKLEYTTEHLTIHGCKDYETDQHVKIKGVPKSAIKLSDNSYQYMQFLGQSTHLTKKVDDTFIVRPIIKELYRTYDKGVVHSDGSVTPISLANV